MVSKLFTPAKIGPLTLRNRTIRSAAFENMCPGHRPSQMLADYHLSVARGGVGMTTIAYASVNRSGLSFDNQLWMRPEIVGELRSLTDAIHREGAKVSIQLGHCGNMSHKSTAGRMPISASSGFNLYSPTFVHGMNEDEIRDTLRGNICRCTGYTKIIDAIMQAKEVLKQGRKAERTEEADPYVPVTVAACGSAEN